MTLKIVTVCGVGMGSSLLLRMYTEDVIKEMGLDARVEASDVTQAKGARADLILTSPALFEIVSGGAAKVYAIKSFVNKQEIREALTNYLNSRHGE